MRQERLRRALNTLPLNYKRVILWRFGEELSFEEIAQRMDRPENAVW
jgi:DNA-directed RNA polymerase specialized sigma24 family protein